MTALNCSKESLFKNSPSKIVIISSHYFECQIWLKITQNFWFRYLPLYSINIIRELHKQVNEDKRNDYTAYLLMFRQLIR